MVALLALGTVNTCDGGLPAGTSSDDTRSLSLPLHPSTPKNLAVAVKRPQVAGMPRRPPAVDDYASAVPNVKLALPVSSRVLISSPAADPVVSRSSSHPPTPTSSTS